MFHYVTVVILVLLTIVTFSHQSSPTSDWNDPSQSQYHIQTDEGNERYFRYQTLSGQYRKEKRLEDGTVVGTYAWIDDDGFLRQRDYVADDAGYRILKSKNVYVGRNTLIDKAIKFAKKAPASAGTLVSGFSGVKPVVEINQNEIPPSTVAPFYSTTPVPPYTPDVIRPTIYLSPSGVGTTELPEVYITPNTLSRKDYVSPSSGYIPPSSTPNVYLPPKIYQTSYNITPVFPSASPQGSVTYQVPSSTPQPPKLYVPSEYLPPSSTPLPPKLYLPAEYLPPSSTPVPPVGTPDQLNVYLPSKYLPPAPPSLDSGAFIGSSSTPNPPKLYLPAQPDAYLPPSRTLPTPNLPSYNSGLQYFPSTTQLPPRSFLPGRVEISLQSEEPPIHLNPWYYSAGGKGKATFRNGPTYPIDNRGNSYTGNQLGNGYDPQYELYDGVSVTNDGFRYYIPRAYHEEQTLPGDKRSGSFGYIDPFGIRRVTYYNTGPGTGFQHKKNNRYVGFDATPYDPKPY